jgi:glycine/D-amino acid oxidase-like deaminating enzyme
MLSAVVRRPYSQLVVQIKQVVLYKQLATTGALKVTGLSVWLCPVYPAGSSREFSGWESVPSSSIISAILQRASVFLPGLAAVSSSDVLQSTRVGLRPYAVGGLPAIGPVPGLPNVVVAAGHEGSGLCLGPATAELVVHHLLGGGKGGSEQVEELLHATQELLPEQRLQACV